MFDSLIKYLEINLELVKLDIKEIAAKLIVDVIKLLVIGFLISMAVIFFSIALSIWLGNISGSMTVGTSTVGALYVLGVVLLVAMRRKLRPVLEKIVAKYIPNNQKLIQELTENEKPQY
ncbi:MAG: phage holin family protein [Cytophagales bacterium]|nr:phage holin family protein [Bernardetiaceae bacterium]MDW8205590.1 phage holin family protein [Cytophagales bacterium]